MKVLVFGKNKGKALERCEESYIQWLATHKAVLKPCNQPYSDDAKQLLEKKEEKEMLNPVRATIGKKKIFEWQESLQKTAIANEGVNFTADEMYAAILSVCKDGEDMGSKREVTEYLAALHRFGGLSPLYLQKDGDLYKYVG